MKPLNEPKPHRVAGKEHEIFTDYFFNVAQKASSELSSKEMHSFGHKPSKVNAWILSALTHGTVSWPLLTPAIEYMSKEEYPMRVAWPAQWKGEKPERFESFQHYIEIIVEPALKEMVGFAKLFDDLKRQLLSNGQFIESFGKEARTHNEKAIALTASVPAAMAVGGDRKSDEYQNTKNENSILIANKPKQKTDTQRRVAKLKRDFPEIAERISEFKNVRDAERAAGLNVPALKTDEEKALNAVLRLPTDKQRWIYDQLKAVLYG